VVLLGTSDGTLSESFREVGAGHYVTDGRLNKDGQGMALAGQLPWTAWFQELGRRTESRSAQDSLTPQ